MHPDCKSNLRNKRKRAGRLNNAFSPCNINYRKTNQNVQFVKNVESRTLPNTFALNNQKINNTVHILIQSLTVFLQVKPARLLDESGREANYDRIIRNKARYQ